MARRRELSEHPPTTPSVVAPPNTEGHLHRAEMSSESVPPLAPGSSLTSHHGFMPSLTVDPVTSKSDLPTSLKSTYGTADVEAPDSLQETSSTAPIFDLTKQMKSEFVQPLLGAANDSPKLTRKEQAGDELKDISLVKQHGKTDSMQFADHHMANTDETLLKLQNVKVREYKLDSSEQTFTQPQGAMVVQDYQNQTVEQSKSSEDSSPLSQVPQQLKLSSLSTSHPTGLTLMSRRSSSSSSDMQLFSQPPLDVEYNLSGNSTSNATPRLNQQDISESGFDISTLHSSKTLEDSDTTDTETDEESRVSLIPPSWSLTSAKERKPSVHPIERVSSTVHGNRENIQLKSSTSSGFVEVSTGGAWSQKRKQTRTSSGMDTWGITLSIYPMHGIIGNNTVVLHHSMQYSGSYVYKPIILN